ncbi:guanine nucleotide-binding protein subunit alpha [Rhizopus stolonifer]|uniref:Guanine nucleotide-binding protein subunit alpha n=1 Tax=Rhizopus stolonifer TaxID=4846 RepID=A0A367K842_RHIST|nr:guanine nucleotide-binding protein subunit alpha [Rhizopus stolonifer]
MGCRLSKTSNEQVRDREINQQLKQERSQLQKQVKLLMLGAGESGKSTVLKQMKLIHGGYSPKERAQYKEIIYSNTIQSMRVILKAMEKMEIELEDPDHAKYRDIIYDTPMQISRLPTKVADALRVLWNDAHVLTAFGRSREYQLNDSAKYFFDALDRISNPDYLPTNRDVLMTRVKSTGITEVVFKIGDVVYRMVDVGGQRSERKKWIHCFDDVVAIIFMVALSEFDQVLIEDERVNRMEESFVLFDSICNSAWFKHTSLILFLNKTDIFKEKIQSQLLSNTFPDYKGENTYEQTSQYIMKRFLSLNRQPSKQIYTHFTCATDTEQIEFVMSVVNDIIIRDNLHDQGLL